MDFNDTTINFHLGTREKRAPLTGRPRLFQEDLWQEDLSSCRKTPLAGTPLAGRPLDPRIQERYDFPYLNDQIPEDRGEYLARDTRYRRIFVRICSSPPPSPSINTQICSILLDIHKHTSSLLCVHTCSLYIFSTTRADLSIGGASSDTLWRLLTCDLLLQTSRRSSTHPPVPDVRRPNARDPDVVVALG
ncbi:hypothetical protein F511_29317 [Dorcoceras hygrometricum]|uniref:Uncharacterized protein n=1 Tax=Dorcoceras hygrometricum TaxID=472368 RepID=A0A2Z7C1D2_9LAMI|nr:hypothetical protein F511_29317 [Dorcoceras hygrometricum]